ncbi:hypothetical protein WA158_003272 [Blastocystis sp. Blastoise]
MVKEKVLFDIDKFNRLKEDINVYEELMKDVVNVFGSVMNFGIHSGFSINRLIKHIGDDCIEKEGERNEFEKKCVYEDKNNGMNVNMDSKYDNDVDLIRFTNNGPVFQISKSVLDSLKGSFIEEQRDEEYRANDGSIYLDYPGKDILLFSYEQQLEILELFEFCGLVIPLELINCRERRDTKKKKYEERNEVSLFINGNKNDSIKEYLIKNGLWNNYAKNYNNGFINYNHIDESLYMNKKYEYIEYINEYIKNGTIDIEEDKISDINKELLEKEMIELFVNWLGKEKKWKLLFRASEHEYKASEFHKYCNNQGETVTLIKHKGHNNHMNIFGGYADQSWNYSNDNSNCFIFTLSNEHNIPPTRYNYQKTIWKRSNSINPFNTITGPSFGSDIYISNNCHEESTSYCKASNYTVNQTNQKNSLFVNTDSSKSINYFIVEDYEVWRLCDDRNKVSNHPLNSLNFINSNRNVYIPRSVNYYNYNNYYNNYNNYNNYNYNIDDNSNDDDDDDDNDNNNNKNKNNNNNYYNYNDDDDYYNDDDYYYYNN